MNFFPIFMGIVVIPNMIEKTHCTRWIQVVKKNMIVHYAREPDVAHVFYYVKVNNSNRQGLLT